MMLMIASVDVRKNQWKKGGKQERDISYFQYNMRGKMKAKKSSN